MDSSNEERKRKSSTKRRASPSGKSSHKRKKKRKTGSVILRAFIIIILIGCFAVVGGLFGAFMGIIENTEPINTADVTPESYTSIIYDDKGNEFDMLHGEENREYVKLSEIPQDLIDAVVSIEDQRFWTHNGIDLKGILRALVENIKTMSFSQGASTITQQLIKNEVLTMDKKIERKIKEQYLAVTFERDLTKTLGSKQLAKEYILELYLNSIGLNHGLNGVQAAAKFYFGKDVSELTLAECASIAGITKNPSAYSPVSYPENNKERQTSVLNKMLELGYITQEEYDEAINEDIYSNIVGERSSSSTGKSYHNYFVDQVVTEVANDLMEQKSMTKQQAYNTIYSGGLSIYTTMSQSMQSIMEESFKNDSLFPPSGSELTATYLLSVMDVDTEKQTHYERTSTVASQEEAENFAAQVRAELVTEQNVFVADNLTVGKALQAAMVIMDHTTGEVKALVGGRGEKSGDLVYNRATQALRQPGSTFKVLAAYAPAIDMGIVNPATVLIDEPYTVGGWSPNNWYKGFRATQTVREGIKDSLNILAAKTIVSVGATNSYNYLLKFGFTSLVESRIIDGVEYSDITATASLGGLTDGVSVLELTGAYATIANMGEYIEPHFYTKVLDHDGNVLLEKTPETRTVLKESSAFLLTDMMEDVISGGGTGGLARFSGMHIAGKTGTTTDDKDLVFAGYTPYYTAGIWMGYDIPKRMSYDKSYHLLLWKDAMEKIHADLPDKSFTYPSDYSTSITTANFCTESGHLGVDGLCNLDYYGGTIKSDYVTTSNLSTIGECELHKTYVICKTSGKLAGPNCPQSETFEAVLAVDEEGRIVNKIVNDDGQVTDVYGKAVDLINIDISSTCTDNHVNVPDINIPVNPDNPSGNNPHSPDYNPDEPDEIEDIINEITGGNNGYSGDSLIPN